MKLVTYSVKHYNNTLSLYNSKEKLYSSKWFMDFGKFGSELFNSEEKIMYTIEKKFQFWKWKMVFTIKNGAENVAELISQNSRKTIYSMDLNDTAYQLRIHFNKRKSIYKNGNKIAEFDESFSDQDFEEYIKVQLLDQKELEICFLLFSCLIIGETEQNKKAIFTSQKQLEPNEEPWN